MGASPIGSGERARAQLARIIESKTFRNKRSLRRLLEYLAGKSLAGDQESLKEYVVGVEAFGKPPGYDPQTDASVRVQASKLRQALAVYYRTEGVSDPIVIDFPKGHFQLAFRERRGAEFRPPGLVPATRLRAWKLAAASLALVAFVLAWPALNRRTVLARNDSAPPLPPALAAIWEPYFDEARPTIISLGTPLFTKLDGDFFRSPRINDWDDWNTPKYSERLGQLRALLGESDPLPSYIYTGVGEAAGAFQLGKFFTSQDRELSLQRNSLLSWERLKESNVIFLGAPKFNAHLHEFPVEEQFQLGRGGIRNLHPRPGESEIYGEVWNADRSARLEDHALITRRPGMHAQGTVLVLAGRSTEATLAAVEYVTQPHYAAELVERVSRGRGELPDDFQVLVRARFEGQVPLQISYVTHRLLLSEQEARTARARH